MKDEHGGLCDKSIEYIHEIEDDYARRIWRARVIFFLLGAFLTSMVVLLGCAPTSSYLLTPDIDEIVFSLDKEYGEPLKELTSFRAESGEVVTIEKLKYTTTEGMIVVYVMGGEIVMIYTTRDK